MPETTLNKLPPWSFSMIEAYNNCPKQVLHKYILKEKYPETEAQRKGNLLDKAIENRINNGVVLEGEYAQYEQVVATVAAMRGNGRKLSTQLKIGLTRDFKPCKFFDDNVWGRSVLDVLVINKPSAVIIDWKNGKNNESRDFYDGGLQRKIFTLMTWRHFPDVNQITAFNIYLNEEKKFGKPLIYTREHEPLLWREVLPKVIAVEEACKKLLWPEKSGPLCSYCPIKTCQHNRS